MAQEHQHAHSHSQDQSHSHSHEEKDNHHSHDHSHHRDEQPVECEQNSTLDKYIDIAHIPLLLAYPTSLLASSLIFQEGQLNTITDHNVSSINEFLLSILYIPVFLASILTIIYTYMGNGATATTPITEKSIEQNLKSNKVFLGLLGLVVANNFLGSVRTVVLSLVMIINVSFPYVLLSLAFDLYCLYLKGKLELLPSTLGTSQFYFIIFAYFILFQIKDSLRDFNQLQHKNDVTIPGVLLLLSGLGIIWNYTAVQLSMILVTLGCGIILNVTKLDLAVIHFKQGAPTVTGIISILLCFLSYNQDYISNKLLFAGEVLLILITGLIPVDHSLFKSSSHSTKSTVNEQQTILTQLLSHKDTRAIFSFLLLNASFMFVQFLYSFRSRSLGLLSDSLHMALDCTSLALGLVAGVLAKRPPSEIYPFGLARIETLAGFANGVLLIGIVAGIFIEGIERIINPVSLEKTGELLIVSFLGLVVNIVGIFAFNHGHEHGGHSHGHSHSHGDGDVHDNENMKGIFLHILADTLGSAGVVVSTLLTSWFHSNIFDPIASLFIAVMIFVSAIPLIRSSASNLLLSLDDKKDEMMRDILSQISTTPGVASYTTPRFWPSVDVATTSAIEHGHSHSIELEHNHSHHDHTHEHGHDDHSEPESDVKFKLIGYIHVQYIEGENSTIIKKRVQTILENNGVKAWIQVENENSNCWCRTNK